MESASSRSWYCTEPQPDCILLDQSAVWHSRIPRTSSAEGRTLEVVNSPCTGSTKGPTKQGKRDLEKSIGSHRGCLLHQIRGAQWDTRRDSSQNDHEIQAHFTCSPSPILSLTSGTHSTNGYQQSRRLREKDYKHFTNHSFWKTTVRKLQKAGVSNDNIIAITGHKAEQSIKAYVDTDLEDHRHISTVVSSWDYDRPDSCRSLRLYVC